MLPPGSGHGLRFRLAQLLRAPPRHLGRDRFQPSPHLLPRPPARRDQVLQADNRVDLSIYDEYLYSILSLLTTDAALQVTKNQREHHGIRGANSWFRLTRDIAGKTGARLQRLADRVHHPKAISTYKDAESSLASWEASRLELEKWKDKLSLIHI